MGNIVFKLKNIVNNTDCVNIDTSYLINTDLNNQHLPNTNSIPPKKNIYSRSHGLNNLLKFYHQNIFGLKYKPNELLSFLCQDFPQIICPTEYRLNQLQLANLNIGNYNLKASECRK